MPPAPTPMRMRAPIPTEGAALRARFGAPNFIRREMDSELWRYDSGRCAVFFFLSRTGNELRLRYIDTLPRSMIGPDPEAYGEPALVGHCVHFLPIRTPEGRASVSPTPSHAPIRTD